MGEEDYFLAAEMRGRRPEMEDAHVICFGLDPNAQRQACLFGVFDGHGGNECARFLVQNLSKEIYSHPLVVDSPAKALEDSFQSLDAQYLELAKQLELEDGSTASVLLLQVDPDNPESLLFHLASVGDSRALLVRRDGSVTCLVEDHVPTRGDERARVKRDGGFVAMDEDSGIFRVTSPTGGGLAVTRAFGDFAFKPFVTAKPEVFSGEVGDQDAFIVLASDGIWGDLSNKEVGRALVENSDAKLAVEYMMEEAFARGSDDNITVVLVDLRSAKPRLVAEHKAMGPHPTPTRRSNLRRSGTSSSMTTTATAATLAGAMGATEDSSPLLVTVARKMSNVMHMHISTEVDDVQIPGLPLQFSNDLVLWRDPVRTFLWFVTLNALFAISVFWGVSLVSILAWSAALRLVVAFATCRVLDVLYRFRGEADSQANLRRSGQFVDANFLVSERSMKYFGDAMTGVLCGSAEQWDNLVLHGSTTNLLITLRTLTYLYTPTPIAGLSWMTFVFVFTVPAGYARNKDRMEELAKELADRAELASKPYVDRVKQQLARVEEHKARWLGRGPPAPQQQQPPNKTSSALLRNQLGDNYQLSEDL